MHSLITKLGAALMVAACVLPAALAQPPQPVVVQPVPPPGTVVVQPVPPPGAIALPPAPAMLDDRLFAMAAGAGGLAEVVSSQAALARSRDEEVRKFAQQMVNDHTQAHQQLTQVVANKGIGLPLTLDIKDQAALGALSMLQGEEYDREYVRNQVAAHICAVQLFQSEAQNGRDPEIKGFAAQTLPKIQHHLQMARQMMGRGGDRQRGAGDNQGDVRQPEPGAAAPAERPGQAAEAKDASKPEREDPGRRQDQAPGAPR